MLEDFLKDRPCKGCKNIDKTDFPFGRTSNNETYIDTEHQGEYDTPDSKLFIKFCPVCGREL